MVQALFVHGMGRTPLSGWPLLRQLRQAGLNTSTFGYAVSLEDFAGIGKRLAARIAALAEHGDYVLIGHSLGGVLIRAALNGMPPGIRRPQRLFLLGSPIRPARLAQRLARNPIYRIAARDCGKLLGSPSRMAAIGAATIPTTCIAGVRSLPWKDSLFGGEPNDGLVSLSEVSAEWTSDHVRVPCLHTLLPSSTRVAEIIIDRMRR